MRGLLHIMKCKYQPNLQLHLNFDRRLLPSTRSTVSCIHLYSTSIVNQCAVFSVSLPSDHLSFFPRSSRVFQSIPACLLSVRIRWRLATVLSNQNHPGSDKDIIKPVLCKPLICAFRFNLHNSSKVQNGRL